MSNPLGRKGAALGVAGAHWLTRFRASFPYGVQSHDPAVFSVVPLSLSLVAKLRKSSMDGIRQRPQCSH